MSFRKLAVAAAVVAILSSQPAAKAEDPRLHGVVYGGLGLGSLRTHTPPKNGDVFSDVSFLGIPSLGFLPYKQEDKFTYYIAILNFNIPATKKNTQHTDYAYARLTVHMDHSGTVKLGERSIPFCEPVRIVSIWPVNDNLQVNRLAANALSATIQPSYAGISAGSISDTVSKSEAYNLNLAKVIGSADNNGNAAWTYYPEKSQPLILGAKNAIVLFAVRNLAVQNKEPTEEQTRLVQERTPSQFPPTVSTLSNLDDILSHVDMMMAMVKSTAATPSPGSAPPATILPTPTPPAQGTPGTATSAHIQTDPLIVGAAPPVPGELKIKCNLSYRINKFLSHEDVNLNDEDKIAFDGAQTAGNVIAMHAIDLPAGIVDTVAGTFSFVPEAYDITPGSTSGLYAVSKKTGQMYSISSTTVSPIVIPPKQTNETPRTADADTH